MPMVAAGQHRLLAVEAKPGAHPMLQPMQPGAQQSPTNPNDFVTAAVPVFVQAQAQ